MSTRIRVSALTSLLLALLLLLAVPAAFADGTDGNGQDPPDSSAPTAQAGTSEQQVLDLATRTTTLLIGVALL